MRIQEISRLLLQQVNLVARTGYFDKKYNQENMIKIFEKGLEEYGEHIQSETLKGNIQGFKEITVTEQVPKHILDQYARDYADKLIGRDAELPHDVPPHELDFEQLLVDAYNKRGQEIRERNK